MVPLFFVVEARLAQAGGGSVEVTEVSELWSPPSRSSHMTG